MGKKKATKAAKKTTPKGKRLRSSAAFKVFFVIHFMILFS